MQDRLEKLRTVLCLQWGELAAHLDISRSMLDQLRKGRRRPGPHLMRRLMEAEREAGLGAAVAGETFLGGSAALREASVSEPRKPAAAAAPASSEVRKSGLRRELAALKAQVARLEKLIEEDAP